MNIHEDSIVVRTASPQSCGNPLQERFTTEGVVISVLSQELIEMRFEFRSSRLRAGSASLPLLFFSPPSPTCSHLKKNSSKTTQRAYRQPPAVLLDTSTDCCCRKFFRDSLLICLGGGFNGDRFEKQSFVTNWIYLLLFCVESSKKGLFVCYLCFLVNIVWACLTCKKTPG